MTELDRQSRGNGRGLADYLQVLSAPDPFDVPSPSGTASSGGSSGNGSGSSSSGSSGGVAGVGTGGGAIMSGHPNLAHLGTSFSRVASFGNFLQSSLVPSGSGGSNHGNASFNQSTTEENRSSLGGMSGAMANPPSRPNRRRGSSTSFQDPGVPRTNPPTESGSRSSTIIDRERERDRDRETGRITAGTSFNAAGATASESLPSSTPASHSIPPLPEPSSEIPRESLYSSHSRTHSLNRTVTSFLRSQRSRTLASVTPDIETDHTVADRRRQLRERNESEWENQRPLSASSSANTNANRTSVDSTIVDAIMSDLPSSQNSDNSMGFSNPSNELPRPGDNDTLVNNNSLRRFVQASPTSEPWNLSQFPGGSSQTHSNDPPSAGPSRRDGPSNTSTGNNLSSMSGSPIAGVAPFIFPPNRRSLRPSSLDQSTASPAHIPAPEPTSGRSSLTSPSHTHTHRLSAPFLPSLPHLPAPRFSPPRALTRPRGGSVSSNNNTSGHHRQNSNGGDGFAASISARRRERVNPLVQALGSRADVEREDYESPIRNM
ncbi:hypothetical protein ABW20_dc0104021 [Dactylellina cionopaga]|nr:hypothetical protein ABW20_dc0104021 [Dactylellina cionopaga]